MTDAVIEAHGLNKRYNGHHAVRGIDLSIAPRQCFGLLGPNGAGKTTTLNMILGRSPMDGGSLKVFGLAVPGNIRQVRARIGLVPQSNNLDPELTVIENLRVYGSYFDIPRTILEQRVQQLLEFVELADRLHDRPGTLSGGMKRRLIFARALINDPALIVLDEPTNGLDPQGRHMLWSRLRDLKAQGRTLLLTTHFMEEAERLCDQLVIMDHGRILEQGTPDELIARHVEPQVVEIFGTDGSTRQRLQDRPGCRLATVGDTIYCYTRDAEPVLNAIDQSPGVTFSRRSSNLEDVFLKLTGHELRD